MPFAYVKLYSRIIFPLPKKISLKVFNQRPNSTTLQGARVRATSPPKPHPHRSQRGFFLSCWQTPCGMEWTEGTRAKAHKGLYVATHPKTYVPPASGRGNTLFDTKTKRTGANFENVLLRHRVIDTGKWYKKVVQIFRFFVPQSEPICTKFVPLYPL